MAHIDGADEPAAQRAEKQLWKEFILCAPRGQPRRDGDTWPCCGIDARPARRRR